MVASARAKAAAWPPSRPTLPLASRALAASDGEDQLVGRGDGGADEASVPPLRLSQPSAP